MQFRFALSPPEMVTHSGPLTVPAALLRPRVRGRRTTGEDAGEESIKTSWVVWIREIYWRGASEEEGYPSLEWVAA